ncbi:MAG: hypothetical protein KC422_25530, partial [Trueperaceae bacterium]|nr:hypothetical protein [Trueperaceae bacterium]
MVDKLLNLLRGSGSKAPSLDAILNEADKHLTNFSSLVLPTPEAKPRTPFDSGLPKEKMSMMNISLGQRLKFLSRGLPLFLNMQKSARMYDGKFKASKTQASPEFFRELENLARRAGAKDLAYVKVPRNAIFQGKGIPHEYAIVFTVEMQKAAIDTSPSFESQYEVIRGYKNLAIIGNKLARFMHKN